MQLRCPSCTMYLNSRRPPVVLQEIVREELCRIRRLRSAERDKAGRECGREGLRHVLLRLLRGGEPSLVGAIPRAVLAEHVTSRPQHVSHLISLSGKAHPCGFSCARSSFAPCPPLSRSCGHGELASRPWASRQRFAAAPPQRGRRGHASELPAPRRIRTACRLAAARTRRSRRWLRSWGATTPTRPPG